MNSEFDKPEASSLPILNSLLFLVFPCGFLSVVSIAAQQLRGFPCLKIAVINIRGQTYRLKDRLKAGITVPPADIPSVG